MKLERTIETFLFASRWLLVPVYVGLAISLVLLLAEFAVQAVHLLTHFNSDLDHLIVGVLGLLDISLMTNLIIMVVLSGYENFVSKFDLDEHKDRPNWMGHIGFSEIKMKLMASIIAISAIHLLEDFMNAPDLTDRVIGWRVALHSLFVISGVLLALMDRLGGGEHDHLHED